MVERFERAQQLYREGLFSESAELLRELIALKAEPVLYYNLARAYDSDGKLAEAIDSYLRFIELAPEVKDRGAIEKRIETLRRQLDERARLARGSREAKADQSAPAPAVDEGTAAVPWVLLAVGAATLIVGVVLGGLSVSRSSDAADATIHADASAALDEARDFALGANISFAAGGVIAAAGATWLVVDAASKPADKVGARVTWRF